MEPADPREVSKWARAYGQNRSLPLVIYCTFFVLLTAAIGVPSYLAGMAYNGGYMILCWICVVFAVFAFAAIIYFSRCGRTITERIAKRFYQNEGDVAVSAQKAAWTPTPRAVLGVIVTLFVCLFATAILDALGYLPEIEGNGESSHYMQPITAIYGVPAMVVLILLMRPAVGWLSLLWPGLYGLHAILIVAGAPILTALNPAGW